MSEVQFDSNILKSFDQGFNLGLWNYSNDVNTQKSMHLVNYITDLDLVHSDFENLKTKYLFFKNFGEKKIFIIFNDYKDININQINSILDDKNLSAVGINTKKNEESLKNFLHLQNITSIY